MIRAIASVYVAGIGVMAAEILVARLLAPSFGASLTTWAILIAVTLLLGSFGAAIGGVLASSRRPSSWLGGALLVAAVGMGLAAGAYALQVTGRASSLAVGTSLAALLLLLPIVLPLAAVLPLASARGGRQRPSPRLVGGLVAVSTLGSLVGTLGAALLLVPALGLRGSFLALAVLMALTAFAVSAGRARIVPLALATVAGIALVTTRGDDASVLVRETAFGRVEVARDGRAAQLRVDGILQGARSPLAIGRSALLRNRQYMELLPYLHPRGRRAVNIGLGMGVVPRMLEAYGIDVESIEINPAIVELASTVLGFDGTVRLGDGRVVLRHLPGLYDFVVLDAFQGEVLPPHLVTREAFEEAREHLEEGGILGLHLIGRPQHPATAAIAATLASVFPHLLAVRAGVEDELQDLYLFASDAPLAVPPFDELTAAGWMGNEIFEPPPGGRVLTDDHNPIERLNESQARALREASRG